jgi:hypothetical protein
MSRKKMSTAAAKEETNGSSSESDNSEGSTADGSEEDVDGTADAVDDSSASEEEEQDSCKICLLCEQAFGSMDADNPAQGCGYDAKVEFARNGGNECLSCFYARRGSFPKTKLKWMGAAVAKSGRKNAIANKFKTVRVRTHRHRVSKKKKDTSMRYEKVNLKLITVKRKEKFTQVYQDTPWVPLKKFCGTHWPGKKLRTLSDMTRQVKMKFPTADIVLDEKGGSGVVVEDDENTDKVMRRALKLSSIADRKATHGDKDNLDEAFEQNAASIEVRGVKRIDYNKVVEERGCGGC